MKDLPITDDVNIEWKILIRCIEKAGLETLGTRKWRKGKRQWIWDKEIGNAVKKHQNYLIHLQQNTEESRLAYILNRNKVKTIIRNAQSNSWVCFISNIENDLHGSEHMIYKALKLLNSKEWGNVNISVIKEKEWIEHNMKLWFNEQRTS